MDFRQLFGLDGRTALVTGASSGLGLHIARTYAAAGAKVALAARRLDRVHEAASVLCDTGHTACGVALDVTRPETIAKALDEAESQLGSPIDILFNNAGVLYSRKFLDQEQDKVEAVFNTDLKGAFLVAQEVARRMATAGGGAIINVSSTSGLRAGGMLSSYGAAKAGLIHLTKVMALELAGKKIRVNTLCPGNFETEMHADFVEQGLADTIIKRIPQRRFGVPADLDGAALLLASDAGSYITGATITVDGGQTLTWM